MEDSKTFNRNAAWILGLVVCAVLILLAWASLGRELSPSSRYTLLGNQQAFNDTTPKKAKPKANADTRSSDAQLEKAISDLNKAISNLEAQLKKRGWERDSEDWEKVLKALDLQKLQLEAEWDHWDSDWKGTEEEMKKAQGELERSFKAMEWEKLADESMRESEWKKAEEEMKRSMQDMQKGFEKAEWELAAEESMKALDMEKMHESMGKMELDMEKMGEDMRKAELEMKKANADMKDLKALINALDKDGLIKKYKPYEIKIEDSDLYIDGKKQPDSVTDKYRKDERFKKYFEKGNHFRIQSDGKDDDGWL